MMREREVQEQQRLTDCCRGRCIRVQIRYLVGRGGRAVPSRHTHHAPHSSAQHGRNQQRHQTINMGIRYLKDNAWPIVCLLAALYVISNRRYDYLLWDT
jgi:hypothetical protein